MPIISEIEPERDGTFKMPKWMECSWRRVPCNKGSCPLCGRILRDREKHLMRGEDPDDMRCVFEDVGNSLGDALAMIRKDAERMGIDITNLDDIKEPPEPKFFPLYRKVSAWRDFTERVVERAEASGSLWFETEAAADLMWYMNTITSKTYRQLTNRWEMTHGDTYGEFDHSYTRYVLRECITILKRALTHLALLNSDEKENLCWCSRNFSG